MAGRNRLPLLGAAAGLFALAFAAGHVQVAYALLLAGLCAFCFTTSISLNWQIVGGALLGVSFGLVPESQVESIQVVGRVFIAMLKMLIAPMILCSIVCGIAGMASVAELGRIGARTLLMYSITGTAAILTGLVLVNAFDPGTGSGLRDTAFFTQAAVAGAPEAQEVTLGSFLLQTVFQALENPFASLAQGRILPIVLFAILLGVTLLRVGPAGAHLIEVVRSAYAVVMSIIQLFVRFAPLGIFALIGHLVATVGFRTLVENLFAFALVVIAGTAFHAALTLPLIVRVLGGMAPGEFFRGIREAMLVAFSTSSSAATLPVTTRCVEENLGVPPQVSSFVLPLGTSVNLDGTALYEAIAAVFVANVYGIELGLGGQAIVFLIAMLTAVGAPGIPSAGMVTMIVVLESVGLPVEAVGVLITIDRFLDTFRTMANVEGDAVVAVCVAHGAGPALARRA
jgi:Na+/H+-dicarboxylate symporter